MGKIDHLDSMRSSLLRMLAVVLCGAVLEGCAHPAPATLHGRMAVISGRGTAGESVRDATQKIMIEGAAITLDHGYRYFEILAPAMSKPGAAIRPGADVTIEVYGTGEIDARRTGVFDADAIAAGHSDSP
jgi:hypothetical protein